MAEHKKSLGLLLVIIGSVAWGASGTVADYMFLTQHIPVIWVVGVRMISAGILLLLTYKLMNHQSIFIIWHDRKSIIQLLIFSVFGMLMSQFCYLSAVNYGNAATATVLQFTAPVFIIGYYAITRKKWPIRLDVISIVLAVIGTYLLATKGHFDSLSISALGLFFGIAAGVANANCTIIPIDLLNKYDAKLVCGWAMIVGSLPLQPIVIIKASQIHFSWALVIELVFIALIGTMLAYLFYEASLNYLKPAVTGTMGSFEPLTATILSIVFLHIDFNLIEIVGAVLILGMALLQSLPNKNELIE